MLNLGILASASAGSGTEWTQAQTFANSAQPRTTVNLVPLTTGYAFINANNSSRWTSWDSTSTANSQLNATSYIGARQAVRGSSNVICFVFGSGTGTAVYRSTNGLSTISSVRVTDNSSTFLATDGAGNWLAAYSNDAYTSADNGATWTARANVFGTITVGGASYNSNAGLYIVTGAGTSYYTSADGITWTLRTLPQTPEGSIYTIAGFTYFKRLNGGQLYRSSDLINWTNLTAIPWTSGDAWEIQLAGNSSKIVAAVIDFNSAGNPDLLYTYQSTDNGSTWQDLDFFGGTTNLISYDGLANVYLVGNNNEVALLYQTTSHQFVRLVSA